MFEIPDGHESFVDFVNQLGQDQIGIWFSTPNIDTFIPYRQIKSMRVFY
jgi:hypothetical protein